MQTHAVNLARFLAERGHTVEVATYRGDGAGNARLPYPVRRWLNRIGHWTNLRAAARLAAQFRPDLIYSSTAFFGHLRPWIVWPYPLLSGALSLPWVERPLYEHFRRLPHPEHFDHLLLRRRLAVMQESAGYVTRILANSAYTAGLPDSLGVAPGRVSVLPGGVDAMGRVLCEADASGVPVAAARSRGIPSVIRDGDNGLLFAENDERACAGARRRRRDDRALAEGLRERGFHSARRDRLVDPGRGARAGARGGGARLNAARGVS